MDPQIKHAIVIEACARAAHEVNRAYCLALGDESQVSWETAPAWVCESALAGVRGALGSGATPEQTHEAWCAHKRAEGWVHGPVKDGEAKTHPCLVPYADLPEAQKRKDGLYLSVVQAMASALGAGEMRPAVPPATVVGRAEHEFDDTGVCRQCSGRASLCGNTPCPRRHLPALIEGYRAGRAR